jgi:O-antigen/teichoic acid export membrane protein
VTRTRRFLHGTGLSYLYQAIVTLVGLWVTRFLLTRLGAHDYGLWLVTLQLLGYLLLADLGVVALLPRETAYAKGRQTSGLELRGLTGRTVRLVLWQLPFVALAAVAVWLWLPDRWAAVKQPLGPLLIAFVVFFPLRVLPALLQGLQDLAFAAWAQLAAWVVTTATSVGLVLAGHGVSALAAGWIAGQVILTAICWIRLRVRYPSVLPGELPRLSWPTAQDYLSKSVWVSAAQVSQAMLVGSDVLLIGAFLGPAAVVPYACTSKLVSLLTNQPLIFMHSAVPGLSEMRTSESRERITQATTALTQGTMILSGAVACLIFPSNQWFVGWWVGAGNYGGFPLTAALLASMIVRHGASTIAFSLFAFGHERRLAVVGLADGVATVLGTSALVHLVGPVGAPLASFATACLVSLPPMLRLYARATGVPARSTLGLIWPWCVRFLAAAVPTVAIAALRPPTTLIATVAAAGAATLMYAVLQARLLVRAPLARYVPRRMASMLARLYPAREAVART